MRIIHIVNMLTVWSPIDFGGNRPTPSPPQGSKSKYFIGWQPGCPQGGSTIQVSVAVIFIMWGFPMAAIFRMWGFPMVLFTQGFCLHI